jgi:cobalamin biosynthesis protein CobT
MSQEFQFIRSKDQMTGHVFMDASRRAARVFGRATDREIKVIFSGSEAYTDGTRIVMPGISPFAKLTPVQVAIGRGYLDHEAGGHMRHTNMKQYREAAQAAIDAGDNLFPVVLNCLEDVRIEPLVINDSPGALENLSATAEAVNREYLSLHEQQPNIADVASRVIALASTWWGRKLYGSLTETNGDCIATLPPEISKAAKIWAEAALSARSTLDVIYLTKQLCDKVRNDEGVQIIDFQLVGGKRKRDKEGQKRDEEVEKQVKKLKLPKRAKKKDDAQGQKDGDQKDQSNDGDQKDDANDQAGDPKDADAEDEGDSENGDGEKEDDKDGQADGDPCDDGDEGDDREGPVGDGGQDGDDGKDEEGDDDVTTGGGGDDGDQSTDSDDDQDAEDDSNGGDGDGDSDGPDEAGQCPQSSQDQDRDVTGEHDDSQYDNDDVMDQKLSLGRIFGGGGDTSGNAYTSITDAFDEYISEHTPSGYRHSQLVDPKGRSTYDDDKRSMRSAISTLSRKLTSTLKSFNLSKWRGGQFDGSLDSNDLIRAFKRNDDVYESETRSKQFNTAVSILCDCSSSMIGAKAKLQRSAVIAIAESLEGTKCKYEILGFAEHCTSAELNELVEAQKNSTSVRVLPTKIFVLKDFNQPLHAARAKIGNLTSVTYGNTNDTQAIIMAASRLLERREERKVMFVLSDGEPGYFTNQFAPVSTEFCGQTLRDAVAFAEERRIELIGIGILNDSVKRFYPKSVVVTDVNDLGKSFVNIMSDILTGKRLSPDGDLLHTQKLVA